MGGDNSKTSVHYRRPMPVPKSILKKPYLYPNGYGPGQTGYPQHNNYYYRPYNQNNRHPPPIPQTQINQNPHENSPPKQYPQHSSHSPPHRSYHHYHQHHHTPSPDYFDRATQTSPSVLFRVDDSVRESLEATHDHSSTPPLLRDDWQSSSQKQRVTPPFLRERSSLSSIDDYVIRAHRNSPPANSTPRSTSIRVIKQSS